MIKANDVVTIVTIYSISLGIVLAISGMPWLGAGIIISYVIGTLVGVCFGWHR